MLGVALWIALAACGGGLAPVHNIQHAPVVSAGGQPLTIQQVREAVMRALVSRDWQVDREGPDGVVATTTSRGHSATVLIQYDARAYSISYLDSSPGLKFNGSSIHRRYNDWIEKLDRTIRKLLTEVAYYPAPPVPPGYQPPPAAVAEPAPATAPPPAAGPVPAPPPAAPAPDVAPQYQAPPPPPPPAPAPRK